MEDRAVFWQRVFESAVDKTQSPIELEEVCTKACESDSWDGDTWSADSPAKELVAELWTYTQAFMANANEVF